MKKTFTLFLVFLLFAYIGNKLQAQVFPFSIPGATNTYITCTNDSNDFAGYYDYGSTATHAFIYDVSASAIVYVDYPGALQTFIYGINNHLKVVGAYNTTGVNTNNEGFSYDDNNFTYTDLTTSWLATMDITIARDINDADCIIGDYKESATHVSFSMCSGTNTPFHYNYNPTYMNGINNNGKRAGLWIDGSNRHGLIWENNVWTQYDYPGSTRTMFTAINDSNIIVGVFDLNRSFVYKNGVFKEIKKTDASDFQIRDINNKGYAVGYFKDASNTYKGFTTSVCEIDFRPKPDGWKFRNGRENCWPATWYQQFNYTHDPYLGGAAPFPKMTYPNGTIDTIKRSFFPDWPLFVRVLGEEQCYFVSNQIKVLKYNAVLKYKKNLKEWGGSCFGFVQSSFMAYDSLQRFKANFPNVGVWSTNKLYDNNINIANQDCINNIMVKQSQIPYNKYKFTQWYKTPTSTLEDVKKMLFDNSKNLKGLILRNQNGGGGHIVNPYKVLADTIDLDLEYIYIYDNNYPNDTTRVVTVNKALDSWYYNLSLNSNVATSEWGGDNAHKGLFLGWPVRNWYATPLLDSLAKSSFMDDNSKSTSLSVYFAADCDFLISNAAGQTSGLQANLLIDNIPGAYPLNPETGTAQLPEGYYLPDGQYNIQMKNFNNTGAVMSIFGGTSTYSYSRGGANLSQKDLISYGTNGLKISNTDNITKNISLSGLFEASGNELVVEVSRLGLSANGSSNIQILNNDDVKLINTGAAGTYDLFIRNAGTAGEKRFLHDTISIAANTTHIISPDWTNLQTSNVTIYIDNANNGTTDDTLTFANEEPAMILTFPLSFAKSALAATDTIRITNTGGGSLSWSAASDATTWLSILSGATGSNSGIIRIATTANAGASRTGHITISSATASNSPYVIEVKQNGIMTIPANVLASDGSFSDGVHLSWTAVPTATHYMVYRSSNAGSNGTAISGWITTLTYTDATAANGEFYFYSVKAAQNISGLNATDYSIKDDGWRSCFTADFSYSGTCTGQPTSFNDNSSAHSNVFYLWDINNDGVIDYKGNDIQHTFSTVGNYTVKLTVTDSLLCSSTKQYVVAIKAFPIVALPNDTTLCANQSLTMNAGSGFGSYLWSTGATTAIISVDSIGHGLGCTPFYVQVANTNGCSTIAQILVSWIVCADVEENSNDLSFNLYPNPAHDILNVSIKGNSEKASISIFSNNLQLIYQENIGNINGEYLKTIDLKQMKSGIYFMRFVSNDVVKVAKIIVY